MAMKEFDMLKTSNRTASSTQTRADAGDARSESAQVDQRTMGKSLRDICPRESHADWKPPSGRPDPMQLLEHSNKRRMVELIPQAGRVEVVMEPD
jgi:hypothetical protein